MGYRLSHLWKWKIPLKIYCFLWLSLDSRITTWDFLVKRGWNGPNICCLCGRAEEYVNHLFIDCHFGQTVRKDITLTLNFEWSWDGPNLNSNLR